jgi:hypothetical protein
MPTESKLKAAVVELPDMFALQLPAQDITDLETTNRCN